jgi:hypothetical protein
VNERDLTLAQRRRLVATHGQPVETMNTPPPLVNPTGAGSTASADQIVGTDSCGVQMGNIVEALLLYCERFRQLPPSLEDLQKTRDVESPLALVCPISHKPYQYEPRGLSRPGLDKRIIIYDPQPSHDGKRWVIMMPTIHAPGALGFYLDELPEADFRKYQPPGK